MSALPKPELTPDEQFIMQAVQDGRAKRIDVSMKAIGTPDVKLQARVTHLDTNHCHRLDKARQLTGALAPIVLFRGGKPEKLYLGDGHHRHWVYRNANLPTIPAWVIDSSNPELEALEFATMCNREMCLGRTEDDVRRAVIMLLENPIWWLRSNTWIGEHVGCSTTMVSRIRIWFCGEFGKELPDKIQGRNGIEFAYTRQSSIFDISSEVRVRTPSRPGGPSRHYVTDNGATIRRCYTGRPASSS